MRCAARLRCRRTARNRARLGLNLVVVALASNAARHAIAWKILSQDFEIDKRDIPKHFRGLADDMGDRAAISGTAGECVTWTDQNIEEMLEGLHEAGFYDFQRWEE